MHNKMGDEKLMGNALVRSPPIERESQALSGTAKVRKMSRE
jgi:hypothetical protein